MLLVSLPLCKHNQTKFGRQIKNTYLHFRSDADLRFLPLDKLKLLWQADVGQPHREVALWFTISMKCPAFYYLTVLHMTIHTCSVYSAACTRAKTEPHKCPKIFMMATQYNLKKQQISSHCLHLKWIQHKKMVTHACIDHNNFHCFYIFFHTSVQF